MVLLYISLLICILQTILAVKFDLVSTSNGNEYCLSQYIAKDMLCTTNLEISNEVDAHQKLEVIVRDKSPSSNQFYSKPEIADGKTKFAFKTHEWADVEFCFTNTFANGIITTILQW